MKARVYGWAQQLDVYNCSVWFSGGIRDVMPYENSSDRMIILDDPIKFIVHRKQIEPIKEITITEEEFDVICMKVSVMPNTGYIAEVKKELFKDVK